MENVPDSQAELQGSPQPPPTASQPAMQDSRLRWAFLLGLLTLTGAAAFWMGRVNRPTAQASQGLVVAPESLFFGERWEDVAFRWPLTIENHTSEDIPILGFSKSCACLSVEPTSLTVPVHGTANVTLTLDLTSRQLGEENTVLRDFATSFSPKTEKMSLRGVRWEVSGRVRTALTFSPHSLYFGTNTLVRGQPFPSREVVVTTHADLTGLKAKCDRDWASVAVNSVKGEPRQYRLSVTPRETISTGRFRFAVTVEPVGREGKIPALPLTVEGMVRENIQVLPDELLLGGKTVGKSVQERVVVYSADGRPFEVLGIETLSPDTVAEPCGQDDELGHVFRVKQKIKALGDQTSTLQFLVQAKDAKEPVKITLNIRYKGLAQSDP